MRAISFSVLAYVVLSACSDNSWSPFSNATAGGPDETSVVPQQPLQTPPTLELPTPTPGGTNRGDPSAEDIAARQ